MGEPADSVQDLPDRDRRDAESLAGDLVETGRSARFRLPPYRQSPVCQPSRANFLIGLNPNTVT